MSRLILMTLNSVNVTVRIESSASANYSNILSVANGLCVDVNGKNPLVRSGFFLGSCLIALVRGVYRHLELRERLQRTVALRLGDPSDFGNVHQYVHRHRCIVFPQLTIIHRIDTGPCLPGVTGVCQVTCDAQSTNQQWAVNAADNTIRLASDSDSCLTVANASDANIVFVSACTAGETAQQWVFTSGVQYAGVYGRLAEGGDRTRSGYGFTLNEAGQFQLSFQGIPLSSGTVSVPVVGSWHSLSISFQGYSISASINGTQVLSKEDSSSSAGLVALVSGWGVAYFDDFSVGELPNAAP
jgi:hypothetical protein